MKKPAFILFLILITISRAWSGENLLCFTLDWQMSIRAGIEHRFNPRFGLKSDAGIGIPGIIVVDAFGVVYLLPESSPWELNICAGIPNAGIPIGATAAMASFGASLLTRREFTERISADLRIGAGFPLFFEKDKDMIRDISFPFDLWPDLAFEICLKLSPPERNEPLPTVVPAAREE